MAPRRALAGLLAAPVLVLTGCGDGSSVADPPVHSRPHSVATSDPPAHETAEHFIRRFAGVEAAMENSGDTADYIVLAKSCRPCLDLAHQVEGFYKAGGFVHWGGWTIQRISAYPNGGGAKAFKVTVNSAPTTYKESASASTKRLHGGPATEVLRLRGSGNSWVVVGRARISS